MRLPRILYVAIAVVVIVGFAVADGVGCLSNRRARRSDGSA